MAETKTIQQSRYYVMNRDTGEQVGNDYKTWGRARNRQVKLGVERYEVRFKVVTVDVPKAARYDAIRSSEAAKGERNDCTVIAAALATGESYEDAHAALELFGRKPGHGTSIHSTLRALDLLGYRHNRVQFEPASVQTIARQLDPKARYVVFTSNHALAVVDGVVEDWSARRKHHVQSVYEVIQ